MGPLKPDDKVVDFSNYGSKIDSSVSQHPTTPTFSPSKFAISKRLIVFFIILITLVAVQGIILIIRQREPVKIPAGYQIVKPQNGPPRVEKIK